MRSNVKALVEVTEQHLGLPEPIAGIGSYHLPRQALQGDLRRLFSGKQFMACGIRLGLDIERLEDIEALSFLDGSVGSVIMIDTLEHVMNCRQAMSEVYRVLRPGGVVVASSSTDIAVNEQPADRWRFAPDAYKHLFQQFGQTLVGYQGNLQKPHTVFAVAVKEPVDDVRPALARIQESYYFKNTTLAGRMVYVYHALRDLAASLRGEGNQMNFELVTQAPTAERADGVAETPAPVAESNGNGNGKLAAIAMRPVGAHPGFFLETSFSNE